MTALPATIWRAFPLARHLSNRLTPVLLRLPITPNQVTAASLVLGLAGGGCFAFGEREIAVIGACSMIGCYILDNCDGDIARVKNLGSRFGHYFDSVTDWLVDTFFFLCLGIGTWTSHGQSFWLWLGAMAAAGATLSYVLELRHDMAVAREAKPTPENAGTLPGTAIEAVVYVFRELARADFCFIVLALAYFDGAWLLLPLGALGAQAYWVSSIFVGWRRFHV